MKKSAFIRFVRDGIKNRLLLTENMSISLHDNKLWKKAYSIDFSTSVFTAKDVSLVIYVEGENQTRKYTFSDSKIQFFADFNDQYSRLLKKAPCARAYPNPENDVHIILNGDDEEDSSVSISFSLISHIELSRQFSERKVGTMNKSSFDKDPT